MSDTLLYSDGPDWFVCSDHPAGLFYSVCGDMFTNPRALHEPKVELGEQEILYLPIAMNVALMLHRSPTFPQVRRAPRRMIAAVNSVTVANAERFVFSPTANFIALLPGGYIGDAEQTLAELRSFLQAGTISEPVLPCRA